VKGGEYIYQLSEFSVCQKGIFSMELYAIVTSQNWVIYYVDSKNHIFLQSGSVNF